MEKYFLYIPGVEVHPYECTVEPAEDFLSAGPTLSPNPTRPRFWLNRDLDRDEQVAQEAIHVLSSYVTQPASLHTGASIVTIIRDYGEAYAGLPTAQDEYVFSRLLSAGESEEFIVCDVFLEAVLEASAPGRDGWTSILLEYHCNVDWLEEPWTVPNTAAALLALRSVSPDAVAKNPFGSHALRILPELIDFLKQAENDRQQVILSKR